MKLYVSSLSRFRSFVMALAMAGFVATSSQAAVLYFDPVDLMIDQTTAAVPNSGIFWDLDGSGAPPEARLSNFIGSDFALYFVETTPGAFMISLDAGIDHQQSVSGFIGGLSGSNVAKEYVQDELIGPSATWFTYDGTYAADLEYNGTGGSITGTPGAPEWDGAGTGFLGLRLDSGTGNRYGWARISYNNGAGTHTVTLHDFAIWDIGDENKALGAGQVPEPGRALLVCLGAMMMVLVRRRK
jgi:hypothetical protein